MRILFFICVSVLSLGVAAQPEIQWETTDIHYSNNGPQICLPINNSYIFSGSFPPTLRDNSGAFVWMSGTISNSWLQPTPPSDPNQGIMAAGYINGICKIGKLDLANGSMINAIDVPSNFQYMSLRKMHDGYYGLTSEPAIVKFDLNGNTSWTVPLPGFEGAAAIEEAQSSNGQYFLVAVLRNSTTHDWALQKFILDNLGHLNPQPVSSFAIEEGVTWIPYNTIGNYFGSFTVSSDKHSVLLSNTGGVLTKLDENLVQTWSLANYDNYFYQLNMISPMADGGFLLTGLIDESNDQFPVIVKINAAGTPVWKILDSEASHCDGDGLGLKSICEAPDGSIVALGEHGCVGNDHWMLTIKCLPPNPPLQFKKCAGKKFDLRTVFHEAGVTYTWPGGSPYVDAGIWAVSGTGLCAGAPLMVEITDVPAPQISNVGIYVCGNQTADLTAEYDISELGYNFYWHTSGGIPVSNPTAVGAGEYRVTAAVPGVTGCNATAVLTVDGYPSAIPPSISPAGTSGIITMAPCGNVVLSVSGQAPFTWYFNGNYIAGVYTNTYTATQPGTYTAMSKTNSEFCYEMSAPRVVQESDFTLSPNPTTASTTVTGVDIASIQLLTMTGGLVQNVTVNVTGTSNTSLNLSALANGTYRVLVTYQNSCLREKMVIKN